MTFTADQGFGKVIVREYGKTDLPVRTRVQGHSPGRESGAGGRSPSEAVVPCGVLCTHWCTLKESKTVFSQRLIIDSVCTQ